MLRRTVTSKEFQTKVFSAGDGGDSVEDTINKWLASIRGVRVYDILYQHRTNANSNERPLSIGIIYSH